MDVISSCFFGIDTDSIKNPDNEVLQNIQAIFSSKIQNLKLLLARKSKNYRYSQNGMPFLRVISKLNFKWLLQDWRAISSKAAY
jgi:hypothetical protein